MSKETATLLLELLAQVQINISAPDADALIERLRAAREEARQALEP